MKNRDMDKKRLLIIFGLIILFVEILGVVLVGIDIYLRYGGESFLVYGGLIGSLLITIGAVLYAKFYKPLTEEFPEFRGIITIVKMSQKFKRIREHLSWLFFSIFWAVIIAALLVIYFSPCNLFGGSADSARYLLSALAQSQAAIVAIVVTLTLVAVQLVSQTYSPRVMDLFFKGWPFWTLLLIYGISTMYDVVLLNMIPPIAPDKTLNVTFHILRRILDIEDLIFVGLVLMTATFSALFLYIGYMMNKLKPKSIIEELSGIDVKSFVDKVSKRYRRDKSGGCPRVVPEDEDQVLPLVDITKRAIRVDDLATARDGVSKLMEIVCGKAYLFSWDNVPGTDNERLLGFLRDDLDIGWAENAEIRKSDDGKTICIFKDENSAEIMIVEKKEKATLKISDGKTHDLKVKKENCELNIYRNSRQGILRREEYGGKRNNILRHFSGHLEDIGKVASYQGDERTVREVAGALHEIADIAIENGLEDESIKRVPLSLYSIGNFSAERRLMDATTGVINALGGVGVSAAGKHLHDTTETAINSLRWVGVIASKKDMMYEVEISIEQLGKIGLELIDEAEQNYNGNDLIRIMSINIWHIVEAVTKKGPVFATNFVAKPLKEFCIKAINRAVNKLNGEDFDQVLINISVEIAGCIAHIGEKAIEKEDRVIEDVVRYLAEIGAEMAKAENWNYIKGHTRDISLRFSKDHIIQIHLSTITDKILDKDEVFLERGLIGPITNFHRKIPADYAGGFLSTPSEVIRENPEVEPELEVKYKWVITCLKEIGLRTSRKSLDRPTERIIKSLIEIGVLCVRDGLSKALEPAFAAKPLAELAKGTKEELFESACKDYYESIKEISKDCKAFEKFRKLYEEELKKQKQEKAQ